jgi:hypothetical protein
MTKRDIINIGLLLESNTYEDVIPHSGVIVDCKDQLDQYRKQLNKMLIDVILKGKEVPPQVRQLHNLPDDYVMYDYNQDLVSFVLKSQNNLVNLTAQGQILHSLRPLASDEEMKKLQDYYLSTFPELIPDPSKTSEQENYPLFASLYVTSGLTNKSKLIKSRPVNDPNQLENAYKFLLNYAASHVSKDDNPQIYAEYEKGSQI